MPAPDDILSETVDLTDEAATAALAADLAACLKAGDLVALAGGLGAGKTTFARHLLRALADDPALEVPSPTFTIVQTYATPRLTVAHIDLYRLSGGGELDEVGFWDALRDGAALVEWPERAGDVLPEDTLTIAFGIAGASRRASISGRGALAARFARSRLRRRFLDRAGWRQAGRCHLMGDASTRTFERIAGESGRAVLMDWPGSQLPEGDPRAPFRARGIGAFVAVAASLREAGISAPEIFAADAAAGLVLMEDLGGEGFIADEAPVAERYEAAVDMLAAIHAAARSGALAGQDGGEHRLPAFGAAAIAAEIDMFTQFYIPHATGEPLTPEGCTKLAAIWEALAASLAEAEQSWVLFDVQSVNLLWLPERAGIARVGIVDFQDMFVGPAAYDVASLCLDARVTIPADLEASLCDRYVALRRAADSGFNEAAFAAAYAICGTVRILKNMGAFARLAGTGKQHYLNHLPRLREYLRRTLLHPVLSPFALWYEGHLIP